MKTFALFSLVCVAVAAADPDRQIEDAFRAAYSNRSDELGDFFNKTFGPGGDAEEIATRFKTAWQGANEGVKQFVNETYWNISRTMRSADGADALLASYPVASAAKHHESKHEKPVQDEPEHKSILDTAWNYFKSVFGVNPDRNAEPVPSSVSASSVPAPSASMAAPQASHHSTVLGLFTLVAGVFLLVQAGVNRNSWINKQVSGRSAEIVPGYVRLV